LAFANAGGLLRYKIKMISQELIKKVRQIQIYTSRAVNASFAGQYESVFKGRGMQFEDVREYMPGDDIRAIDWNVTARTGKPYIKRFVEEREMTVIFAVDLSASGRFGTLDKTKNQLAAEFCAVLAFAAAKNNDKVGLLIFTDQIELYFQTPKKQTNIPLALDYLAMVVRKRAVVFVVSDFIQADFKKSLSLLNRWHDCVGVCVSDPAELALPKAGIIEFTDAETGEIITIDTSNSGFRRQYEGKSTERVSQLKKMLRSINVDCIGISTGKPYINDLIQFFHQRHRRY
jgi:uncharacterized protein (DUF58 family)